MKKIGLRKQTEFKANLDRETQAFDDILNTLKEEPKDKYVFKLFQKKKASPYNLKEKLKPKVISLKKQLQSPLSEVKAPPPDEKELAAYDVYRAEFEADDNRFKQNNPSLLEEDKLMLHDKPQPVSLAGIREESAKRMSNIQERCITTGEGYSCPTYPLFNERMEGLTSGLYMFAGESNSGKTALMTSLAWSFMSNPDNHLYMVFFTLDDAAFDLYPRIIAQMKNIPIGVVSKPQRYERMLHEGHEDARTIRRWLRLAREGWDEIREVAERINVFDGNHIQYGEEILDKCRWIKASLQADDPKANILVVIDSLMDIEWRTPFSSEKEKNDYTAKEIKKWAVESIDCPIFGSLHLRKIDQNRRPNIADVKESGRYAYEASFLGIVHNDMSRNPTNASIVVADPENPDNNIPVIELSWAKNKKSSFKGLTFHSFNTNRSKVDELPPDVEARLLRLMSGSRGGSPIPSPSAGRLNDTMLANAGMQTRGEQYGPILTTEEQ